MPDNSKGFSRFWLELKRRKVLRSLAIYAGTAFIILEAATIIFPRWNFPDWSIDLVLWLLILGAFVNVIIAWIYDITSGGMQRTKAIEEKEESEKTTDSRGWMAATYISLVVIAGLLTLNIVGGTKGLKAGDIQSLVILPFDNFTGDEQLDYFVSGMHASLVNDMGQISGLRVISKTSANAYKDANMTLREIARELKVDGVVEASVLCLGDSMCMQFRLIDATGEEKQLWNADYREEKGQVLNLFNRITRQIAQEVKIEILPGEQDRLTMDRRVDPDAYDAFLKAQYHWEKLSPLGLDSALYYYQLAIDLDPDWADPYGGMATTLSVRGNFSKGQKISDHEGAFYYLDRALELDPDAAFLHYTRGLLLVWPGGQWKKGEEEFLLCLKLKPSDALCRIYYAHLLMILHRFDEAREQADRALELDPLRPLVLGLYGTVMNVLGDHDAALEQAGKALAIDPGNNFASGPYSDALLGLGDTLAWYEIFREGLWYTTPDYLDSLDLVFREEGFLGVVRERLRVFDEAYRSGRHIPLNTQAARYLIVGEFDKAIEYYNLARQNGDGLISYASLIYLDVPEVKEYEPFLELLRELKLPLPE